MTIEDIANEKLYWFIFKGAKFKVKGIVKGEYYIGYDCTTSYSAYDEVRILPHKNKFRKENFELGERLTDEEVRQSIILLMFENITNDV